VLEQAVIAMQIIYEKKRADALVAVTEWMILDDEIQ
jgi:hypothetical protein